MHTCHRYTYYVIRKHKKGTCEIKNMTSNNLTPATPEDATWSKTNMCKKLKIINSDEKYASVYV